MTEPRYRPSIRSDGLYEIFLYPDDPHWEEANKHLQRHAPYPLSNGRAFVGRAVEPGFGRPAALAAAGEVKHD